jgi:hypothetical protein
VGLGIIFADLDFGQVLNLWFSSLWGQSPQVRQRDSKLAQNLSQQNSSKSQPKQQAGNQNQNQGITPNPSFNHQPKNQTNKESALLISEMNFYLRGALRAPLK